MTIEPGTLLHDRYRIVRQIGAGGMGAVFEAIDTRLQNTVAVKQTTVTGPVGERAFEREAKTLAGLRHPALPVVSDYFTDAGGQFLVMQFIDGDDLSRVLRRQNGPCAPDDVLAWARTILDALDYLHSHQPPIIHRDIKPANLRRTPRGEIVLLDFGLAKTRRTDETRLASDHSVYGYTPHYAPPEQIEGRTTDARSDLYALGATLYHLAVGVAPLRAADRAAVVRQGLADPLVAPHRIHGRIGEAFALAVVRALQLDPARRFASAAEMRAALLNLDPSRAVRPAPSPDAGNRRVDAAMPSLTEVGRQTDLIVQVRFGDSPLLGIEDWPTRRVPDGIQQASENLRVSYPVNPDTGAFMPARLLIRLITSDFSVGGDVARLIEVPPDEYSKRLAFLLTPLRSGFCRVNIDVFDSDSVYLGSIPVEIEAKAGAAVAMPEVRVAHLVLEVVARHLERRSIDPIPHSALEPFGGTDESPLKPSHAVVAPRFEERAASEPLSSDAVAKLAPKPEGARLSPSATPPIAAASPPTRRAIRRSLVYVPLAVIILGTATMFWEQSLRPTPTSNLPSPAATTARDAVPPPPAPSSPTDKSTAAQARASKSVSEARRSLPTGSADATRPTSPPPIPRPTATPSPATPVAVSAPPPPASPRPSLATMNDEAMIRALVDSFAAGYSKKDVKAITLLWPSAPVDQLQSTFAMYESITLTLSLVSIKIDGDTATAVIGALTLSVDSDATTYRHERQSSWRFRKLAGGWIIVSQQ